MAGSANLKPFQKGDDPRRNKVGGPRPGSGRPANWLKSLCDDQLWKHKLAEQMGDIASGKPVGIEITDEDGKKKTVLRIPSLDDIRAATEWLADRAHGKPKQSVDVDGNVTVNLISAIKQARAQRGLKE